MIKFHFYISIHRSIAMHSTVTDMINMSASLSACDCVTRWQYIKTMQARITKSSVIDSSRLDFGGSEMATFRFVSRYNFGIFRDETKIVTCSLLLPFQSSSNRWPWMTTNGHFTLNYASVLPPLCYGFQSHHMNLNVSGKKVPHELQLLWLSEPPHEFECQWRKSSQQTPVAGV